MGKWREGGLPGRRLIAAKPSIVAALRLQRRLPPLLPLPSEAVVCRQAGLVLSAYGAWLPNHSSASLVRGRSVRKQQLRIVALTAASSNAHGCRSGNLIRL